MYEVNKEAFAAFLTQQRKEKGWTQKDLAERLFVSDKAVSKWERGLSLPDISLLIPLADSLGVGVTELLEGKRMEKPMEAENVELLVKKALSMSEEDPEQAKQRRRERAFLFAAASVIGVLEYVVGDWLLNRAGYGNGLSTLLVYDVLGLIFGLYFWCFMKEKLPGYYDENRISFYSDGFLKLSFPGVSFNNTNWPRVVKALRIWSLVTIVTVPLLNVILSLIPMGEGAWLVCQTAVLVLFLAGLFLPVYLAAGREGRKTGEKGKKRMAWIAVAAVCVTLLVVGGIAVGMGNMRSSLRVGCVSSSTSQKWTARYHLLTGTEKHTLYPKQEDYLVTVVTEEGTLTMEIQDETGMVFSESEIRTGTYPVRLEGKTQVMVKADGHEGSFAIVPEETQ